MTQEIIKEVKVDNYNLEITKRIYKDGSLLVTVKVSDKNGNMLKYKRMDLYDNDELIDKQEYTLQEATIEGVDFREDKYGTFCKRGRGKCKTGIEDKLWAMHEELKNIDFYEYE